MFVHVKMQVENLRIPENGFTLNQIMHFHINFHKLARITMWGGSSILLPETLAKKNVVTNKKNNDEKCFKWDVTVILHH